MTAIPSEDEIRGRLAGGKIRARAYGICDPHDHVRAIDMRDKLIHRAALAAGLRCYLCGDPISSSAVMHLDHVTPLAAGGRHLLWNLEAAHDRCNLQKGDALLPYDPPIDDLEPLLERLRRIGPDALWDGTHETRRLARKVIRTPRPNAPFSTRLVPVTDRIAEAILERGGDIYLPAPVSELSGDGSFESNHWVRAMGVYWDNKSNDPAKRNRPDLNRRPSHPFLVPCRYVEGEGSWGVPAFRIRYSWSQRQVEDALAAKPQPIGRPDLLVREPDQVAPSDWVAPKQDIDSDDRTDADRRLEAAGAEEVSRLETVSNARRHFGFEEGHLQ